MNEDIDVASIRKRMNMSQNQFAVQFGISVRTLQGWERGRRTPTGASKILLTLINRSPGVILEFLNPGGIRKPRTDRRARARLLLRLTRITAYAWNDLTPLIKARRPETTELGQSLIKGMGEIKEWLAGEEKAFVAHIPTAFDTARIARQLGLSREEFSIRFHLPIEKLEGWESGRVVPAEHEKAYIVAIDRQPNAVLAALS